MAAVRRRDLLVFSVFMMFLECYAVKIDLAELLRKNRYPGPSQKRIHNIDDINMVHIQQGNPCQEPEKPFPCQSYSACISMVVVCDDNYDCEDGSDEDIDMCTALSRPPVEDIEGFLKDQHKWIGPILFGKNDIRKVAHGLAVSQNVDDLMQRLGLGNKQVKAVREILNMVEDDDDLGLEDMGMPSSAWNEVHYFFSRLMKSGFA